MAPHDFLDEEWTQAEDSPEDRPSSEGRSRPRRSRRIPPAAILALGIVVMLVATGIVLWQQRDVTPAPVRIVTPEETQQETAPTTAAETSEPSAAADAPPSAEPAMEQIITRWATRETPEDDSWVAELEGTVAPDAARRIQTLSCLPVQSAPLRVEGLRYDGSPLQDDTTWTGSLTLTVTDSKGAQTPVAVRATGTWNPSTSAWILTELECLSSGGSL